MANVCQLWATVDDAHLNIVHERIARFGIVLGLDKQQFIAQQSVYNALIIPGCHNRFQIQV